MLKENKFDYLIFSSKEMESKNYSKTWDKNKKKIEKILNDNHLLYQSLKDKEVNGSGKTIYPKKNYMSKLKKDYVKHKNKEKVSNESLATLSLIFYVWKDDKPPEEKPEEKQDISQITLENTQKIIEMLSNGISFTTEKQITETSNIEMVVNDPKPIVMAREADDEFKTSYKAILYDYDTSNKSRKLYSNKIVCKESKYEKLVYLESNDDEEIGHWYVKNIDYGYGDQEILHIRIDPHNYFLHQFKAYNYFSENEEFIYKDEEYEGKDEGDICNQVVVLKV